MTHTDPGKAAPASSLWSDLKDIWTKAGTVAAIITLPTLTFAGLLNKLIEPVRPIGEIILLTWPLVISATLLAMLIFRGSLRGKPDIEKLLIIIALIMWPYLIAYFLGVADTLDARATEVDSWTDYHPVALVSRFALGILVYYFTAFGIVRIASAVVCGVFLAWAFEKKILPHLRRALASDPAATRK